MPPAYLTEEVMAEVELCQLAAAVQARHITQQVVDQIDANNIPGSSQATYAS
jgi:hypothetical protein